MLNKVRRTIKLFPFYYGLSSDLIFYIAINTDIHDKTITLPLPSAEKKWYRTIDTSMEENEILIGNEEELKSQEKYVLLANSIIVLISK